MFKTCGLHMENSTSDCSQIYSIEHSSFIKNQSWLKNTKLYNPIRTFVHNLYSSFLYIFNQLSWVYTRNPHTLLKLLLPYKLIIRKG